METKVEGNWTFIDDKKLNNLINMGMSVEEIANILNRTEQSVRANLIALDLYSRQMEQHSYRKVIDDEYAAGLSSGQISIKYAIPLGTVMNRVKVLSHETPKKEEKEMVTKQEGLTLSQKVTVAKLWARGFNLKMIAAKMKLPIKFLSDEFYTVAGVTKGQDEFSKLVKPYFDRGAHSADVAKELGASLQRVKDLYTTFNSVPKIAFKTPEDNKPKRATNNRIGYAERASSVKKMKLEGKTSKEIAKALNISHNTVDNIYVRLKKQDATLPDSRVFSKHAWTETEVKELLNLHNKNYDFKQISLALKRSVSSINNKLWKLLHCNPEVVINPEAKDCEYPLLGGFKGVNIETAKPIDEPFIDLREEPKSLADLIKDKLASKKRDNDDEAPKSTIMSDEEVSDEVIIRLFKKALKSKRRAVFIL